ncbi:MAG: methylated-DNA--[protein]-cysteine S-methyltransferase [Anaerovoracaceae bacterium]
MKHVYYYDSPVGKLKLVSDELALQELTFLGEYKEENSPATQENSPLIKKVVCELNEYFAGNRQQFTIPLDPQGTPFQKKDWKALCDIPYGQTRSYKDIAQAIGCPKGARAVGLANNKNPISIIIPCHRVIGADGKLVGYGGGIDKKVFLLDLENATYKKPL